MSYNLPDSYANCELLPFNRKALDDDFVLSTPSQDPGGGGYRLMLQGTKVLVDRTEDINLPRDEQAVGLGVDQEPIFIGHWKGIPCRLQQFPRTASIPQDLQSINILDKEPGLPLHLLSLAGLGNSILHWERTSRCCDNCGGKMERLDSEWGKKCRDCGSQHYPRIHPCIIVLVRRNNEILLVRKPEWAPGRFGLVAGFVEFGENLEQTVVRELFEETGITVTNVCYQGSQSWPFPSQLMTGFTADYNSGEIKLQDDELSEGNWYPIDNLPQLPPRRSIARWLIDMAVNDLQIDTNRIKG